METNLFRMYSFKLTISKIKFKFDLYDSTHPSKLKFMAICRL